MQHDLAPSIMAHKALVEQVRAAFPEESEDDLADSIEGLSTIDDAIFAVLRAALEREAMAKALGEMIESMAGRKGRLLAGAQSMRAAALHAMQECGLKKLQAPDMSLSVSPGKPKLIITDEAAVPPSLCRVKSEPDKKAIAEWLVEAGTEATPSWITWGNPQPFLSIHRR
jgi:hypothetical protein